MQGVYYSSSGYEWNIQKKSPYLRLNESAELKFCCLMLLVNMFLELQMSAFKGFIIR